jgi:hypothetical protein
VQSSAVHNGVCHLFDILVLEFSWILMLLMGFTLPVANDEGPEDILDSAADFNLGMVLTSLEGAPQCRITSCKVLTNAFSVFRGYVSQTVEVKPPNSWAMVTPESTAGTSEYTVLVASASSRRCTFYWGNCDL